MVRRMRAVIPVVIIAALPSLAWGRDEQSAKAKAQAEKTSAEPLEGIWPTERMIESTIQRWALEAADAYELTDEQYQQVEVRMLKRWPTFMEQNRRQLQPLLNEYFEAQLSLEPPSQEQVQSWAKRAMPVLGKVRKQLDAGQKEIRELLNPEQHSRFDAQAHTLRAGMELLTQKVQGWSNGRYTPGDMWNPPRRRPDSDDGCTEQERASAKSPASAPPDQIELELQGWDRYVADFIEAHELDEGQQAAARSMLTEVKERARAHRDRHKAEIRSVEEKISAGRPDEKEEVRAALQRLYGPIDALFGELEERLNKLPTQAQRRAATQPAE